MGTPQLETTQIESYLGRRPEWGSVNVAGVAAIGAGWESEIYGFEAQRADSPEPLVVRMYTGGDGPDKAVREGKGMMRLHQAGYPVPQVLLYEPDPAPLGLPFIIMERIAGRQMWPEMQAAATRPVLEQRFVDLLLKLHDLDIAPFAEGLPPADDGRELLRRDVALWETVVERAPIAGFAEVLEWFATNLEDVQPLPPSVVHNDFHPGNVMVTTDDKDLVIDWTSVEVADRRNDLAWTLMLIAVGDGEDASHTVADLYKRAAAAPDMDYFMAGAYIRRLFTLATSVVYGPEALGMRPEAVAEVRQHLAAATPLYDEFRRITGRSVEGVELLLAE